MESRAADTFEQGDAPVETGRPWLGVRFSCSGAYQRVYRSADGMRYQARCPRCGRPVTFRVGEGGTSERFFIVRCGV